MVKKMSLWKFSHQAAVKERREVRTKVGRREKAVITYLAG